MTRRPVLGHRSFPHAAIPLRKSKLCLFDAENIERIPKGTKMPWLASQQASADAG